MANNDLIISKLSGYAGIRLRDNEPLLIQPGINLLVGRNGSGKSNLLRLMQFMTTTIGDIKGGIESSFFRSNLNRALKSNSEDLYKSFGQIPIVQYRFRNYKKEINISLSQEIERLPPYVINNIKKSNKSFREYIDITKPNLKSNWNWIHNNYSTKNIELSGHPINNILNNRNDSNEVSILFNTAVDQLNNFATRKMIEIFESQGFKGEIQKLEESINYTLHKFLGATTKKIKIHYDLKAENTIELILMDHENCIDVNQLSHGESVLLNLVFSFKTARTNLYDFMVFDEPELHMHDDMISVLVDEINSLSEVMPKCKILIATHSTSLIEQLANINKSPNLILFDEGRNVYNSNNDIDFVKALKNNGVWFTPLMLSKKRNIFIENIGKKGLKYQKFYMKFFPPENLPNVISIGSGGNVEKSNDFAYIISDLVNIESVRSVGIRDGDLWIKKSLVECIKGEKEIKAFIRALPTNKNVYIKDKNNHNQYFFNFWEIENLYLYDELIKCWSKNGTSLTVNKYRTILKSNCSNIAHIYLHTFFKTITNTRFDTPNSIKRDITKFKASYLEIDQLFENFHELENRAINLVNTLIESKLARWLPGKEIKQLVEKNGYIFDDSRFNFSDSVVGKKLRNIFHV